MTNSSFTIGQCVRASPHDVGQLEKALRTFFEGESTEQSSEFSSEVNARLKTAPDHAMRQAAMVDPRLQKSIRNLLGAGINAGTAAKKVMWMRKAADQLAKAFLPYSACRTGCSHCCHIPVKISENEAREMGKAIGRKPVPLERHHELAFTGYEYPCPFLAEGACTVYEDRPAVCRTHMNLDQDELLCRLDPNGVLIPVPYLDTRLFSMYAFETGGNPDRWGDLRQWFPASE